MKRLLCTLCLLCPLVGFAQNDVTLPNVTLEMETSTNASFIGNDLDDMTFKMNRVRLGFNGDLGCRNMVQTLRLAKRECYRALQQSVSLLWRYGGAYIHT